MKTKKNISVAFINFLKAEIMVSECPYHQDNPSTSNNLEVCQKFNNRKENISSFNSNVDEQISS